MRNPNGFGSVVKLSGNRRNPYGARLTVGFKAENGFPIYKFIGYYPTRKEAMTALALYHSDPSSVAVVNNTVVPTSKITLQFVYDEWSNEHFQTISKNTAKGYKTAIKALEPIYNRPFENLTIKDYEDVFIKSGKSKATLNLAKMALKLMYVYAYRKEYIPEASIGIPQYISLNGCVESEKNPHKVIKEDDINALWNHRDEPNVQIVLFMIYTGVRIEELSEMRKSDVFLDDRYIHLRKSKTKAGLRDVPLNEKIVFIVRNWLDLEGANDRLVPLGSSPSVRVNSYKNGFDKTIKAYCSERYQQHDTRHTCTTMLTEAGVDERYIKLIIGHASQDVTNRVYAKKLDIKVLIEAINKI